MKKRILLIFTLLLIFPVFASAEELVTVNMTTQFNEDVNIDDISSIDIDFLDGEEISYTATLYKTENFSKTLTDVEKSIYSHIDCVNVYKDHVNRYPITYTITDNGSTLDIVFTVSYDTSKKTLEETKDNHQVSDDTYIRIIGDYGGYLTNYTSTTTTTKVASGSSSTGTNATTTNQSSNKDNNSTTETTTIDKSKLSEQELKQVEEEEKEQKQKKNVNKVINIILIIIGALVLIGIIFVAIKIANANK